MSVSLILAYFFVGIQGVAMVVDEFYFHRKRGLGRWESIGHPVDSAMFLLPILLTFINYRPELSWIYFCLAFLSCLIVTKDEWIHKKECCPAENWLHSILFLVHSAVLWILYDLWVDGLVSQISHVLTVSVIILGIYQIVYWNFWRMDIKRMEMNLEKRDQ